MKLGSLFDGSGGFPLAGVICGITPVWASEVESYWEKMREAHAGVTGKPYKKIKTTSQLISWLNKLHNDSAEYKMWGNGIALPCAVDVLWRIAERERKHEQGTNDGQ